MTLCFGYHLIPLRYHCKVSNAKHRVRITDPGWRTEWLQFASYHDAQAFIRKFNEGEDNWGQSFEAATYFPPRKRPRTQAEMSEQREIKLFAKRCDPMAIQAKIILKLALEDMRYD